MQVIYERGELATGMYFIVEGHIDLLWSTALPSAALQSTLPAEGPNPKVEQDRACGARKRGPGDIFGELALFPKLAGSSRVETAVARDWGLIHMLPVSRIRLDRLGERARVSEDFGESKAWEWQQRATYERLM